ncbi:protein-disulfide reductase DsbD, partial [Pseudoalteromonas sp. S4389]
EFDHYTFPDAQVQEQFAHFELLQIDFPESDAISIERMDEYTVFVLPSIIFLAQRVTGLLNPKDFAEHRSKVRNTAK